MIKKVPERLHAAFSDGSGEEYITTGPDGGFALALRWGCSCCKDTSPLTPPEVAFRDRVVAAYNAAPELLDVLRDVAARWDSYDEDASPELGRRIRAAVAKAQASGIK